MNALLIYSDKTGISKSEKKNAKMISKLKEIFSDLKSIRTNTIEDFSNAVSESIGKFDVLVVAGGDGTLKLAINELMKYERDTRPILGYIPAGTVNDAGKAFGCGQTIKSGLKNLKKLNINSIDIMKANETYINFVAAIGAFSDISYSTPRSTKKIIGRLAYYIDALPKALKRKLIDAEIFCNGESYKIKAPFLMILNSKNVGGFPVNFKYSVKDGMAELFATKRGLFNGLIHYVFFKTRTLKLKSDHFLIKINSDENWCFDGEKGDKKDLEIFVLKQEIKVIGTVKR